MKSEGHAIDDNFLIDLITKRCNSKDCLKFGWILEDFPKTLEQAQKMCSMGLTPTNVFFIRICSDEVYKRTADRAADTFECNRTIVAERLRYSEKYLP